MGAYAVLIYRTDDEMASLSEQELVDLHAAHRAFQAKHAAAIQGGDALLPSSTAKRVAVGDGSLAVTDGPWAETKEALGGFYAIEAADLDEAVRIASDVPTFSGGVEVRPVMIFE